MGFHCIEISVLVQEFVPSFNAERADDEVGCFADGDPSGLEGSVIVCCGAGQVWAKHRYDRKAAQ